MDLVWCSRSNSLRPLAIGKQENGAYVAASETCATLESAEFVCNVGAGN